MKRFSTVSPPVRPWFLLFNLGQQWTVMNKCSPSVFLDFYIWVYASSKLTSFSFLRSYWCVSTISRSDQVVQRNVWLKVGYRTTPSGSSKSVKSDEVYGTTVTLFCSLCMLMHLKCWKPYFKLMVGISLSEVMKFSIGTSIFVLGSTE